MKKNLPIRPLAWQFSPGHTSLTPTFYALGLPKHWKDALFSLELERLGKPPEKTNIPCDGLHRALTALVGDLLVINKGVWGKNPPPYWMFSDVKIPTEALYEIVVTWADLLWGGLPNCASMLNKLSPKDLRWVTIAEDLAQWDQKPNGTATPVSPYAFRLLPHYLAAQFSRPSATLQIGNAHRQLRRCPTSNGAELMTWPPETFEDKSGVSHYCATLRFTVQTVPFQSFPVVNCEVGVRRWKMADARYVGEKSNVYLLSSVPWLPSLHQTQSFQVAPISWDASQQQVAWDKDSYLIDLLNKLHPHHRFPLASDIFQDGKKYFTPLAAQFAGIVHSTRMGSHPVGAGMFPFDLRSIGEQIDVLLGQQGFAWTNTPQTVNIPRGFSVPEQTFAHAVATKTQPVKANASAIQTHRRDNAPIDSGGELHIELFFQNEHICDAFERELRLFFGIDPSQSFPVSLSNGKHLHFIPRAFGKLGAALDSKNSSGAYKKRVQEIEDFLGSGPPLHPTVSIIELGDRDYFRKKPDPKNAIRSGFAACGRLTQFLALQDKPLPNNAPWVNAEGAILDAMRQLDLSANLPNLSHLKLSSSLQIVALWLVKNCFNSANKPVGTLPLWLRIDSESGSTTVKARGWDKWLPLRQAQLALADPHNVTIQPSFKENEISAFIEDTLRHDITGETVVFCDAQNSRMNWKWLQDGGLTLDSLQFSANIPAEPLSDWPAWKGLRVIRVRDYEGGEVPQHCFPNNDGVSVNSGVFAFNGVATEEQNITRVFGSINPRPVQFSNLHLGMSRFDEAANTTAWNARLLEITVAALQPGDQAYLWAVLSHRLRESAPHYRAHTALPLPLHLAQKLGEYVLA